MIKNNLLLMALAASVSLTAYGQQADGGISPEMLKQIQKSYEGTPSDKAIRNAISANNINKLAINSESLNNFDTYFSDKVESKGISNQKSSGRCWLFTGLNVLRAKAIAKYDMGEFQFSQNYSFFWDQLEKANLFLQGIIDTREKPQDDKMVERRQDGRVVVQESDRRRWPVHRRIRPADEIRRCPGGGDGRDLQQREHLSHEQPHRT